MNLTEIVVLVGGLILGFGVVYSLMGGSNKQDGKQDGRQGGRGQGNGQGAWQQGSYQPVRQVDDYMAGNWFRILEVSEYATRADIEQAYKNKISQYHPDKVAQMGPEIRQVAEEKSMEINAAHAYAMQLLAAQGR